MASYKHNDIGSAATEAAKRLRYCLRENHYYTILLWSRSISIFTYWLRKVMHSALLFLNSEFFLVR